MRRETREGEGRGMGGGSMQPAEENTDLHEELPHTQWKYMEMHPASGKTHFRGRDTFEKRQNSNKCVSVYVCVCNCVGCV